jgi:flavin reductase (DIM6/NTAB) family NADH-FMN oxidoreductase RutF
MKKSIGARALAYPTPVWLIGSFDREGRPNIMTAAWCGVTCSKPPAVGVSLRKATYTYGNIMARRAFTVNIPSVGHVREADYCGIASGRDTDKFAKTGLTVVTSEVVDAPYVDEFPLILECRLIHTLEIGLHTQFVGEIVDIKAEPQVLNASGIPDMSQVRPFVYAPVQQRYYALGEELGRGYDLGKEKKST